MKLVVAVIRPHALEAVTDALTGIDVAGVTITEVRGHGRQKGHSEVYRGGEYKVDFLPKVEVQVLAKDDEAQKIANTIIEAASSDQIGDGKLWIQPIDSVVRIRTGESGDDAI
jgi:nitrogen regulatory protein PII